MSHKEPEMNGPEMNEIEAALAEWSPRSPQIDRDRLMFAAGRASARSERTAPVPTPALPLGGRESGPLPPRGRVRVGVIASPTGSAARYLWPLATSLSTAAAVLMAFLLVQDRAPHGPGAGENSAATQVAAAPAPEIAPQRGKLPRRWELPTATDGTYLALRNQMLTTPSDQWPVPQLLHDSVRRGAAAVEDDAALEPPTSRNLLREFLPPEPPARRGSDPARRESPDPAETPATHFTEHQEALT